MAFGDFDTICSQASLPICSLLGPPSTLTITRNPLLVTQCSARSIEVANTIIFTAATDFAHIAALIMTTIMIFHVRSKFTAVGRKEILTFFYIYILLSAISLVLDAGVIPAYDGGAFPWFVAVQNGLTSALCTSLLINGFVGFQLYEDGTTLSVWLLRLTSIGVFVICFAVSLLTFKGWAGLGPTNTTGLFVVLYLINAICLGVYVVMQVFLVGNTLQDRWPLFDIAFGVFFFVAGQIILYQFGAQICEGVSHYLDALFFATVCNLLAVMMVYKYWDSITKEDLEFSVGTKTTNWEVKEPFLDNIDDMSYPPTRGSMYDAASLDYRPQSAHQYIANTKTGGGGDRSTLISLMDTNPNPNSRQNYPTPPPQQQQQQTGSTYDTSSITSPGTGTGNDSRERSRSRYRNSTNLLEGARQSGNLLLEARKNSYGDPFAITNPSRRSTYDELTYAAPLTGAEVGRNGRDPDRGNRERSRSKMRSGNEVGAGNGGGARGSYARY